MGHLRSQNIKDLREVQLALVEDDGSVSVIRKQWADPVIKADVDGKLAAERKIDTGGRDEPNDDERTYAPKWLE
jgi:uncharacterized membrane protein YcaP (DUF421 family)